MLLIDSQMGLSVFLEFTDGLVDVHLPAVLEGDDESLLELSEHGAPRAHHPVIIRRCTVGIFVESVFLVMLHAFQPLQTLVVP